MFLTFSCTGAAATLSVGTEARLPWENATLSSGVPSNAPPPPLELSEAQRHAGGGGLSRSPGAQTHSHS